MAIASNNAAAHASRSAHRRAAPPLSRALVTVRPYGTDAANEHLEAFRRWCAGENSLGESVGGVEQITLSYAPGEGFGLHAASELPAGELFRVPSRMLLPSTLAAAKVTMAGRLGDDQLAMLDRAQQAQTANRTWDLRHVRSL
jgi:hypothetical protein